MRRYAVFDFALPAPDHCRMDLLRFPATLTDRLNALPPRIAMQQIVYWGVIVMAGLIIGLTAFYGYLIPARIEAHLDQAFSQRAWARTLAVSDGRRVVLRGELEPGYVFDKEITVIRQLPLISSVDNELETVASPGARLQLQRLDDDTLQLSGVMRGEDLDATALAVSRVFPYAKLRDRVKIDDRVGRPVWLDGLQPAIRTLIPLDTFSVYGWQDALLVSGLADSEATRSGVRYSMPASLQDSVDINFQLRLAEPEDAPKISLVVGWNGAALSGEVGSQRQADLLTAAIRKIAADRSAELTGTATADADSTQADGKTLLIGLETNPALSKSALPFAVAGLLPSLSRVHDLRIATSGEGLSLWGRLDSGRDLGDIERMLDKLPDNLRLENNLSVDLAERKPELSLFRDSQRLIISGRLPALGIKNDLLASLNASDNIGQIEEFISIEPNVAFSPWIERWLTMMPALPKTVFGLTVASDSVLVSGQVADDSEKQFVNDALASMFPGMTYVDWMTVAGK